MPPEPSLGSGPGTIGKSDGTPSTRRLLMVLSTLGGGTGTHLVRLLDHLDQSRWEASILCHDPKALAPPAHVRLIDASTPPGRLRRFPLAQWQQLRGLRRCVRTDRPDLVHAYFFWPIIYGRILKRTGVIRHLVENREDEGFGWGSFEYSLLRSTAGIPDRIVCVSDSVRDVVLEKERADPDRTVVIRNGIDLPAQVEAAEDSASLREELGLESEHLVVGMVANLNRAVKGLDYFIESMPLIAEQVPQARFLIVGGGTNGERLMDRTRELGMADRLILTGFRPDVERFYRIMDVSVLTSLSEGLSITVLESMSLGLPVVATRVGGNPELIREGETGLLVPPRDPGAFARAVVRLLKDRSARESMGRAARQRAEAEFSIGTVSDRYEALYEEVLRGE